jgi:NAD(P)-dependent dehydrogenase (short-subunit alcohol dehydrogenase family)/acyl carrier protein
VLDLARAPLWGLVRSAQSEHPGRLALLDIDTLPVSEPAWQGALVCEEPQLGLRQERLCAPRLVRAMPADTAAEAARPLDPEGTVLITGGTGTLGGLVARHLVGRHGVRHLLLCSRTGRADALEQELVAAGACVRVAACDVSDRGALSGLLSGIGAEHPLTAVIHTSGVIDDGVLDAMSGARIDKVFAPKVDAALHLHELTKDKELAAFVLFSSASGVLGAAGQANYAAANAFLDALAHHRRAQGLPGCSLAWGYWAERSGLTGQLGAADTARLRRGGMVELSSEEGLSLFDTALRGAAPLLVPTRLDLQGLSAVTESLPRLLQGLVRAKSGGSRGGAVLLKQRLAGLSAGERERLLLELVRSTAATVLSASLDDVKAERPLKELGLDSLMALELRNRLGAATGLRLPAMLLFDYPTPRALAGRLQGDLVGQSPPVAASPALVPGAEGEPIAINTAAHPLLGNRVRAAVAEMLFEATIEPGSRFEHRAFGKPLFPLAASAEILLAATRQLGESLSIESLTVHQALVTSAPQFVQTIVSPAKNGRRSVRVVSRPTERSDAPWSLHASSTLIDMDEPPDERFDPPAVMARCRTELPGQAFYSDLEAEGADVGRYCRSLKRLWIGSSEAVGELVSGTTRQPCVFDPALLEGAFQLFAATLTEDECKTDCVYIITELHHLSVWRPPGATVLAHVVRTAPAIPRDAYRVMVNVSIYDPGGSLLARALGVCAQRVEKE